MFPLLFRKKRLIRLSKELKSEIIQIQTKIQKIMKRTHEEVRSPAGQLGWLFQQQ